MIPDCGVVTADGESLRFEGDCAVTIILAARTNYSMRYPDYRDAAVDPAAVARADTNAAAKQRSSGLTARHAEDHRALFSRVSLDLGAPASKLPTDRLRAQNGSGNAAADRALEELYFNFGRYLLIASSRAGSLPANLQGVWNDKATPPWNADYHVNINLQMNYWPAESANLAETADAAVRFRRSPGHAGQARRAALFRRAGLEHVPEYQRLGLRRSHRLAHGVLAAGGLRLAGAALLRALSIQPRRHFPEKARLAGHEGRGGVLAGGAHDGSARRPARGVAQLLARARAVHGRGGDVAADRGGPVREYR